MHSFLIISKDTKKLEEHINKLTEQFDIDPFDITILEPQKQSIGIEEVRRFQKKIILKPFRSNTKAAVIKNGELLTIEAQNALLKTLEEPPNHTIITMTVTNKNLLLPTIQSRCAIVELDSGKIELAEEETEQYQTVITSLFTHGVGEKLKLAQDLAKSKDETIVWLEKLVLTARYVLINKLCHFEEPKATRNPKNNKTLNDLNHFKQTDLPVQSLLNLIISLQKTYTIIKTTNANPRLTLENLFLSLATLPASAQV